MTTTTRLKAQLKLAVQRLRMLQQKKAAQNGQARVEVKNLMEKGKLESARIRVEHVIREDYNCEALEMLEIYCEMLLARFGLIETLKNLDSSLVEPACTIIYASARSEAPELIEIRKLLVDKYGKALYEEAMENKHHHVNERLIDKMKIVAPEPKIVNGYLAEIARSYNIPWVDTVDDGVDISLIGPDPVGARSGGGSGGSGGHSPFGGASGSGGDLGMVLPAPAFQPPTGLAKAAPAFMPVQPAMPYAPLAAGQPYPMQPPGQPYPPTQGNPYFQNQPGFLPAQSLAPHTSPPTQFPALPSVPDAGPAGGSDDPIPDFDELQRRFDAIRSR